MHPIIRHLFNLTSRGSILSGRLREICEILDKIPELNALIKKQTAFIDELNRTLSEECKVKAPEDVDIDTIMDGWDTLLTSAIRHGNKELVKAYIKAKADVNLCESRGDTPCMKVAWGYGDLETMIILAEAGANLSKKNDDGQNALMIASSRGNMKVLPFLLEYEKGRDNKDKHGCTALDLAVYGRHVSAVSLLLSHGFKGDMKKVYQLLCDYDQRDPDIYNALSTLYQQQRDLKERNAAESIDDKLFEAIERHYQALTDLRIFSIVTDNNRKKTSQEIDAVIKSAPKELVELITTYSYPLLSGFSMFKAPEIDRVYVDNCLLAKKRSLHNDLDARVSKRSSTG